MTSDPRAAIHSHRRTFRYRLAAVACGAMVLGPAAQAWEFPLEAAGPRVFLHVGNGTYNADNSTVNTIRVEVPTAQVGNGVPLTMTSDSTQSRSLHTGNITCPDPSNQVMIGASYRRNNGNSFGDVTYLRVSSPASLSNAAGDTIPISEISWTVSGAGGPPPNTIPAGSFVGGSQVLAQVSANTYIENCHTFHFANSSPRAPGTYTGQVVYTIAVP